MHMIQHEYLGTWLCRVAANISLCISLQDILGCLCVNPGRLAKGLVGGTYAKVSVKPSQHHVEKTTSHILQSSVAQVIRI